jgi:hypothetical protein
MEKRIRRDKFVGEGDGVMRSPAGISGQLCVADHILFAEGEFPPDLHSEMLQQPHHPDPGNNFGEKYPLII